MGHYCCCIVDCKNTGRNSQCKFYIFPKASWKIDQRNKWIAAVKRKNVDGSPWSPKFYDRICSEHFIGGKKSDAQASPSYVPMIFPEAYRKKKIKETHASARYKRRMKRRTTNVADTTTTEVLDTTTNEIITEEGNETQTQPPLVNQGCQANIFCEINVKETTFICNTFIYTDHCDAEIQIDIATISRILTTNNSRKTDKNCCTDKKSFQDQFTETKSQEFTGISSIKNDSELLDLAGVSFSNLDFLLPKLTVTKCTVSMKDRLLIFLMKMKTGLTFNLASVTANLVFWPNKAAVRASMPECFRPDYINTRVIIDCTEFRIEAPSAVDNRVVCYSHYKKGFTAKVLIGITPSGFISLKSKVAGGRKSDAQMTVESGLIDLLEAGDEVLADEGFPAMKQILDESGKKVKIIMPPFLAKQNEFSQEETEKTYDIARVRIHVERIMQRLRIYQEYTIQYQEYT